MLLDFCNLHRLCRRYKSCYRSVEFLLWRVTNEGMDPSLSLSPMLPGTYLNHRHVCDGGDVGCSSRRRARSNMSILQGFPTTKCAQIAPSLRVAARTGVCVVARLDHIDIWPAPCASHPSRPGHNASRAYYQGITRMTLFGSQFSAAFAEVILVLNAIIVSIVLVVAFCDQSASACAKVRHYASAMLVFLITHIRTRHR